jgi:formylglycine-generating enzyme required for sulfatase activity
MNKILAFLAIFSLCFLASSCKSSVKVPEKPDYQMSYTVDDVSFDMQKVSPGFFGMGITSDNRRKVDGGFIHEVALDGFVITKEPVTNGLWNAVMGTAKGNPEAPVSMVSWNDIQKFIGKLNKATGKIFMLPTEAQWEYAVRQPEIKDSFNGHSEWCEDGFAEAEDIVSQKDSGIADINPAPAENKNQKVVRTTAERIPLEIHTRRANLSFRLVQPTGEALSEDVISLLNGNSVDREPVDAGKGGIEKITVNGAEFSMTKVKGGTFKMGFVTQDMPSLTFKVPDDEATVHDVTLSDFEIGTTEVTVEQWYAVMGSVPYLNDVEKGQMPVINVSWYDCQEFILRLNALTGRKFRLPTEAEWEYAAKGGSNSRHYFFAGSDNAYMSMWFVTNAKMKVQEVAGKVANELGLYDMSGNAWEWCYDRGGDYSSEAQTDPCGPARGTNRIMRGGSCASKWDACRLTNRSYMLPVYVKGTFGFRLAI